MDIADTPTRTKSQAPPPLRDEPSARNGTAQPPLTGGFSGVMEHERDLQRSTEAYLRLTNGVHATSLHHVLREQSAQLSGNLALLRQRYEALPRGNRGRILRGRIAQESPDAPVPRLDQLRPLIVKHRATLADISTLMVQRADGQRGALILAEVARSHEAMAGALTALAPPDAAVHDALPVPVMGDCESIGPGLE